MSGDILWLGWLNFVEIWKVLFLAKLYFGVVQKTLHSSVSLLSPVSNPWCESRQISLLFLLELVARHFYSGSRCQSGGKWFSGRAKLYQQKTNKKKPIILGDNVVHYFYSLLYECKLIISKCVVHYVLNLYTMFSITKGPSARADASRGTKHRAFWLVDLFKVNVCPCRART